MIIGRKAEIQRLKNIGNTGTKKHIFMALISANGLNENIYSSKIIDSTATLDDLFKDKI